VTGPADGELETAAEMAAALRAGQISAVELAERSIRRAEAWQPWTNAFSQLWTERAIERAREVDAHAIIGPLAGLPVTIKDLYDVAGQETTGCCRAYFGRVATGTAPVVERVLEGGAIPIGKTNQHELAAGGTNLVSACGPTRNSWDPARMTGGSSGGAGVTVATGIAPLALGSDTGGSIRIPAAMCGAFGLKPTYGRLPTAGVMPLSPSMDCPGPLAATAEDLRTLFEVMAGSRPPDAGPVESLRVAPVRGFFAEDVHPECLAAVDDVLRVLGSADVHVGDPLGDDDESRRVLHAAREVWNRTCFPEFAAAHRGIDRGLVSDQPRSWMEQGERFSAEVLEDAARRRAEIGAWFRSQLEAVGALVVPTTAYPAPRADQEPVEIGPGRFVEVAKIGPGWLTCTVNLAGLPAVSIPAARSADGMPIGVSFIGRSDEEEALVGLAAAWERASGYRPARPPLPTGEPPALA
jgi:Asp-tRNA(Asn)/Glu-tRNA(Gln) amidotransferase A subunit family amidase